MNVVKYISIVLTLTMALACSKDVEIGDDQANSFVKLFGDSFEDVGHDLKQTSDGGYVIIGTSTRVEDGDALDKDIILIKTDRFGNHASWSPKYFGGALDDIGYAVQIINDGGYILAGVRSDSLNGTIDKNILIIKTNEQGDTLWTRVHGTNQDDHAFCVGQTSDNGYIIGGYTNHPTQGKNTLLLKTDSKGNKIWMKEGGTNYDDEIKCVTELENGFVFIGTTKGNASNLNISNGYIVKTGATGNPAQIKYFGNQNQTTGMDMKVLDDGSIAFQGNTIVNGASKIYIGMLDPGFNMLDMENPVLNSLPGEYTGNSVLFDQNNFIIAGTKLVSTDKDIFVVSTNAEGKLLNEMTMGEIGDQQAEKIILTNDNRYAIIGTNILAENAMITLVKTQ